MMVYGDVEIELREFVVPAANGSGRWLYRHGEQLVVDVMQKKEAWAHVGNATVTARTEKSYNLGA
jgi:hypothetical protein